MTIEDYVAPKFQIKRLPVLKTLILLTRERLVPRHSTDATMKLWIILNFKYTVFPFYIHNYEKIEFMN